MLQRPGGGQGAEMVWPRFGKLGLHSRAQLAVWAVEHGLLAAHPD